MKRIRWFFLRFDQGQPTIGRGRPRRARIIFSARLRVVTCTRTPVHPSIVRTSISRVHVGRRPPNSWGLRPTTSFPPPHRADHPLPRPRRPPPPNLLGIAADDLVQLGQVPLVQLPLPVVLPMIQQTQFPLLTEPLGHPIHGGLAHPQRLRRLRGRTTLQQIHNHQIVRLQPGVPTPSRLFDQPLLVNPTQFGDNPVHGNSPFSGPPARKSQRSRVPILLRNLRSFNHLRAFHNHARSFSE